MPATLLWVACLATVGTNFGRFGSPMAAADGIPSGATAAAGPIIANEPPNMADAAPAPLGLVSVPNAAPPPVPAPIPSIPEQSAEAVPASYSPGAPIPATKECPNLAKRLALEDVKQMTFQHLDDQHIIHDLYTHHWVYRLSNAEIEWLKANSVSDAVILYMQRAASSAEAAPSLQPAAVEPTPAPPSLPGQPTPFTADAMPPCFTKGHLVPDPPPATVEPPVGSPADLDVASAPTGPASPPAQPTADSTPTGSYRTIFIEKAGAADPTPGGAPADPPTDPPTRLLPCPATLAADQEMMKELRRESEARNQTLQPVAARAAASEPATPARAADAPLPELFTGTHPATFDPKVGLVLPPSVLEQLGASSQTLFATAGPNQTVAIYTPAGLARILKLVQSGNPNWTSLSVDRVCFSRIERVTVDAANHCVLPARLTRLAGISERVVLVGVRDHWELWDAKAWTTWDDSHDPVFWNNEEASHMTPERVNGGIQ
jgi:MraZ protein